MKKIGILAAFMICLLGFAPASAYYIQTVTEFNGWPTPTTYPVKIADNVGFLFYNPYHGEPGWGASYFASTTTIGMGDYWFKVSSDYGAASQQITVNIKTTITVTFLGTNRENCIGGDFPISGIASWSLGSPDLEFHEDILPSDTYHFIDPTMMSFHSSDTIPANIHLGYRYEIYNLFANLSSQNYDLFTLPQLIDPDLLGKISKDWNVQVECSIELPAETPEPCTLSLIGVGMAAIVWRRSKSSTPASK